MKILNLLIPVALVAFGAGCQSSRTQTRSRTSTTVQTAQTSAPQQNAPPVVAEQESKGSVIQEFKTDKATYTVETIPNTRLTPTSREGDKADHVYSSNIIAVYVHTNNEVSVASTNATLLPTPVSTSQPAGK